MRRGPHRFFTTRSRVFGPTGAPKSSPSTARSFPDSIARANPPAASRCMAFPESPCSAASRGARLRVPEREHRTSLAVWDLPSPIVVGRRAKLKVGVSCPDGCNLSGTSVDVYNDTGQRIGTGSLGSTPWPATVALYWAELDIAPPEAEGDLF